MASKTNICNMALGHLGAGQRITNIDEDSSEARACKLFYADAVNAVLTDYRWPFSRKIRTLSLIEETPTDEWNYSYRYPTDCLYIRRILSGMKRDTDDARVPYELNQDDTGGLLIYTNSNEAQIEYTAKCDNEGLFPSDFVLALSYRLAMLIAPQIASGTEGMKLAVSMHEFYAKFCARAVANRLSEEQPGPDIEDSFTRSRR